MKKKQFSSLICLVGPTATGKTSLALEISQQFPCILISADSRQVYKEMDIVTGKDHPSNLKLFGIDLVSPSEEFSVSLWLKEITPFLITSKTPLVVGGTGLYIKALTEGISTISIPLNNALRDKLAKASIPTLQIQLKSLNTSRFSNLNHSDSLNPRRLIRAIEVELYSQKHQVDYLNIIKKKPINSLIIGLRPPKPTIYRSLIQERVISRLKKGALQETETIINKYGKDLPSLTALGYRSLSAYLAGNLTKDELIENWTNDEYAYSKRQLTWFNKVQNINWFSCEDPLLLRKVQTLVAKYLSSCYHDINNL